MHKASPEAMTGSWHLFLGVLVGCALMSTEDSLCSLMWQKGPPVPDQSDTKSGLLSVGAVSTRQGEDLSVTAGPLLHSEALVDKKLSGTPSWTESTGAAGAPLHAGTATSTRLGGGCKPPLLCCLSEPELASPVPLGRSVSGPSEPLPSPGGLYATSAALCPSAPEQSCPPRQVKHPPLVSG